MTLAGERYSSRGGSIAGGTAEVQAMVTAKECWGFNVMDYTDEQRLIDESAAKLERNYQFEDRKARLE